MVRIFADIYPQKCPDCSKIMPTYTIRYIWIGLFPSANLLSDGSVQSQTSSMLGCQSRRLFRAVQVCERHLEPYFQHNVRLPEPPGYGVKFLGSYSILSPVPLYSHDLTPVDEKNLKQKEIKTNEEHRSSVSSIGRSSS